MSLVNYTVQMMREHRDTWKVVNNESGEPHLVNRHGKVLIAIEDTDGNITTVKTLLKMLEEGEA